MKTAGDSPRSAEPGDRPDGDALADRSAKRAPADPGTSVHGVRHAGRMSGRASLYRAATRDCRRAAGSTPPPATGKGRTPRAPPRATGRRATVHHFVEIPRRMTERRKPCRAKGVPGGKRHGPSRTFDPPFRRNADFRLIPAGFARSGPSRSKRRPTSVRPGRDDGYSAGHRPRPIDRIRISV